MFKGIMGKFWLANVVLIIVVLVAMGLSLSQLFQEFYIDQRTQGLARNGQAMADILVKEDEKAVMSNIKVLASVVDAEIMFADRAGIVRGCTGGMRMQTGQRLDEETRKQLLSGQVVTQKGTNPWSETSVLTVMVPMEVDGQVQGAVFLTTPLSALEENLQQIRRMTVLGGVTAIMLATVLGFFLTRMMTKPMLQMNKVALAMAGGNFAERIKVTSADEIGLLGLSLNHLAGELDKNVSALSQERDKMDRILSSMSDGVVTFDREGHVILFNPSMARLGLTVHTGIGINQCCPVPEIKETWEKVMETGDTMAGEFTLDKKRLAFRMAPLQDQHGQINGVVSLFQDVTKERRLENLRREFVGNVSHDLRTPLSLIQGYTEALQDGMASGEEEERKFLGIINNETNRLRRLVDDLIELNRMEEGSLGLKLAPVAMEELLSTVVERFRPMARDRGITLQEALEKLPDATVDGDLVERVMVNLLDNAVEHTPSGGQVEVGARVRETKETKDTKDKKDTRDTNDTNDTGGHRELLVTVKDSGPGIPASELERLWERFYRGDKARRRGHGRGSGLGLTIVKNIVESHGGQVFVESREGEGATFGFTLPLGT